MTPEAAKLFHVMFHTAVVVAIVFTPGGLIALIVLFGNYLLNSLGG